MHYKQIGDVDALFYLNFSTFDVSFIFIYLPVLNYKIACNTNVSESPINIKIEFINFYPFVNFRKLLILIQSKYRIKYFGYHTSL